MARILGVADDKPDIEIKIKKGGGPFVAGTARRSIDSQGFITKVNITVSGSFGFIQTPLDDIEDTTLHEMGHALGLFHHSNEDDLMGRTLGFEADSPSACDLDGFEEMTNGLCNLPLFSEHRTKIVVRPPVIRP